MNKFVIQEVADGWVLTQSDDEGNVCPDTHKATARGVIARLMQLMKSGIVAPQTKPEVVNIDIVTVKADKDVK